MKINTLLILAGIFWGEKITAQTYNHSSNRFKVIKIKDTQSKFDNLTTADGLSNNEILDIFQDKYGFLWIGTYEGLNKYDGYQFQIYTNKPHDSTTISDNYISSITEDIYGNLWIGTLKGLNKYDRNNELFINYFHDVDNKNSLSDNYVREIYADKSGILWIETADGVLNKLVLSDSKGSVNKGTSDKKRDPSPPLAGLGTRFKHFEHGSEYRHPNYPAHQIYEDKGGNLWIVSCGIGLIKFDRDEETMKIYERGSKEIPGIKGGCLSCILNDRYGNLWLGDQHWYTYLANRPDFFKHFPKRQDFQKFPVGPVYDIIEDRRGLIWFGGYMREEGVCRYDVLKNKLLFTPHNQNDPGSLIDNTINKIYEDRAGNIWIGTGQGISKYSRNKYKFKHYRHIVGDNNSLSSNRIRTIIEDDDGNLWIGTEDKGLDVFDRKNGTFKNYRFNTANTKRDQVQVIYKDRSGTMWVGLWAANNGLLRYDKKNDSFFIYNNNYDWIHDLFEDSKGNFWVGIWGNQGVKLFDKQKGKYYQKQLHELSYLYSLSKKIYEDSKGYLWVGTTDGKLCRMNLENDEVEHFIYKPHDSTTFWGGGDAITVIFEDSRGIVWIGSNGLNKFNKEKRNFSHYTTENGLPGNNIGGMLEDDHGYLWISTDKGLVKFDTERETFRIYTESDGLQNNEFTKAHCKLKTGEMVFGGMHGFNIFHPDSVVDNPHLPPIAITKFKVKNRQIVKDLNENNNVTLSYDENNFVFEFAALDFTDPLKNQYAYKLADFDKDWTYCDAGNRIAKYTNIDPGDYVFKVKASNNDGIWQNGIFVAITITPPYWETGWFYSAQLLFFMLLIGGTLLASRKGSKGRTVTIMVYITLFVIFEFIQNLCEPLYEEYVGSAPIIKTLLNLVLASTLLPVQLFLRRYLRGRDLKNKKQDDDIV
ncbi:MAG: hypothetical protein FVQ77_00770 [Cytophagales bacterium]|nr:hypothetical protein [Cytophagales bacterium]